MIAHRAHRTEPPPAPTPAIGHHEIPSYAAMLSALANAVVLLDGAGIVRYINPAAEHLFKASASQVQGQPLTGILAPDHPIFDLIRQVRDGGHSLTEYGVSLDGPRFAAPATTLQLAPVPGDDGQSRGDIVLAIQELSVAQKIDQQLTHRNAARSVMGMAAILAHEVKNPLASIRGAAQLIEENADPADRELTRLICDESDRICQLVDRMEVFSDQRPLERRPVNIHRVMEQVRKIAQTSFARHVRLVETYDPSLPPVFGNRDLLIQVFLNLVRNAVDAVPEAGGEVVLSTAYRHGVRLALPGTSHRVQLPLQVSVQDNGHGIPEDLRGHLFDPFVTTKPSGHGLGLALVAKIVGDHGGVIEFDSEPKRTVFRVMLPVSTNSEAI
ncbi:MAG: PAS domain-containing protein [Alphaproteobacteria bacterium]|nr:PAS domain-containing protein [Alphaproteobacteria bacterium]